VSDDAVIRGAAVVAAVALLAAPYGQQIYERIAQAIDEHGILQRGITELLSPAQIHRVVRCPAHHLDTTGEHELAFAARNGISA